MIVCKQADALSYELQQKDATIDELQQKNLQLSNQIVKLERAKREAEEKVVQLNERAKMKLNSPAKNQANELKKKLEEVCYINCIWLLITKVYYLAVSKSSNSIIQRLNENLFLTY